VNDHLVYVDDGPYGELHLSLECRRAGTATAHGVAPDACAAELSAWLDARPGRPWGDLLVTTSRVHSGDLDPVVEVLVTRRPRVQRLALGAIVFPDFHRGDDVSDDPDRDGGSWRLSVPGVDRLLNALPSLEALVVQASDIDPILPAAPFTAPCLRRLVLRVEALNPEWFARLGRGVFPALTHLELWLGRIAYGWGATVDDLAPLLESASMPALRHMKLVSDLDHALVDRLAGSRLLSGLTSLDLSDGVLGDDTAARLREHLPRFAHLDQLTLAGNALSPAGAAGVRVLGPNLVVGTQRHGVLGAVPFDPPRVSLFDALGP
jgi:hypothetical protein